MIRFKLPTRHVVFPHDAAVTLSAPGSMTRTVAPEAGTLMPASGVARPVLIAHSRPERGGRSRAECGVQSRIVLVAAAVLGLALIAHSEPSFAHAHLQRAIPAADSTVSASPPSLTLRFTEAVEPRFSSLELQDGKGVMVDIAKPVAQDNGLTLTTPLPQLAPGSYTVIWHATSVDTHKTEGKFTFTVGP